MKKIEISKDNSASFNIETLIESKLLVQANSGGGKSWLLRRILEQSHGLVQHIVIDMEGEFATLREKFDYILVGKEGDTPASINSAGLLARKLLELNVSAIIDLYDLVPRERKRFVKLFLESLIDSPKSLWHPVMVVIDEAHFFCPEKGESEAMDAVINLASLGRKRGFCAVLATQRLSKLHKDAAAECNNKMIGRTSLDIDMKRASEELGFTKKEQILSLRSLKAGDFYVYGPAVSNNIKLVKVGKVETSHPKAGGRAKVQSPPAPEKIKAVLSKLADLPKEAQKEARTIDDLKRLLAESKAENNRLTAELRNMDSESAVKKIEVQMGKEKAVLINQIEKLEFAIKKALEVLSSVNKDEILYPTIKNKIEESKVYSGAFSFKPKKENIIVKESNVRIQGGLRRMMIALAQRPQGLTAKQLGVRCGLSSKSGTFGTYLGTGRSNGWISGTRDQLTITQEGLESLGAYDPLPEGRGLLLYWLNELRGGEARMLEALASAYPNALPDKEVAEMAGISPTSGTFGTYLGKLRTLELVTGSRGSLMASDELF